MKFDHVIYALPDSGSHYEAQNLVLYPDVPAPADSIKEAFLSRLLEDGVVVKCAVERDEAGAITGYKLYKKDELPEQPDAPQIAETEPGIPTAELIAAQDTPADRGEKAKPQK